MPLEEKQLESLAREVIEAERTCQPITNFTGRFPEISISDAYALQLKLVQTKVNSGQKIVGRKIGLCAKANQAMYGIDEPIYGHILDSMVIPEAEPVSMSRLLRPVIEA